MEIKQNMHACCNLIHPKSLFWTLRGQDCSLRRPVSTIYALSSGLGRCGVAVLRISGPGSKEALRKMTPSNAPRPGPRKAELRTIIHPEKGHTLDRGLVLWFPGPRSFTGEDSAELHLHGGPAVVAAALEAISRLGTQFRPADPGEFTRRAFAAGKMDLTQVEGLGDLIHAETESQRRAALRQMSGSASQTSERWTRSLLKSLASLEAYIDFAESEEIEDGVVGDVRSRVSELASELESHLKDARRGERLREGVHVAIVGAPNVGKSSLLNLLTERQAAIVSPIAGTTRDVVETRLDLSGIPLVVMDTAGLREASEASDEVEREGIRRAMDNAERADLVIFVEEAKTVLEQGLKTSELLEKAPGRLHLVNKLDLLSQEDQQSLKSQYASSEHVILLSCKTQEGLQPALQYLQVQAQDLCSTASGEVPLLTRERQRIHVQRSLEHLENFLDDFEIGNQNLDLAIVCRHLRAASRELGFLTGKVSSEKILDVIFADFCIGK